MFHSQSIANSHSSNHASSQPSTLHAPKLQVAKRQWSDSVREYVRRSFDPKHAVPTVSKQEMEQKLKEVITKVTEAEEAGLLENFDWDTYQLPQQIIEMERKEKQEQESAFSFQPAFTSTNPSLTLTNGFSSGKKRKHEDLHEDMHSNKTLPPWRAKSPTKVLNTNNKHASPGEKTTLNFKKKAVQQLEKKAKRNWTSLLESPSKLQDLETRRRRFGNSSQTPQPFDEEKSNLGPVSGTCQTLEKSYFRLPRQPRPHEVRPQPVLEKAFEELIKKWQSGSHEYDYVCDQLKAIRQDLFVQHIKNTFTVQVYELHARIALERGDLGEYNQCQTQLHALYALKLSGNASQFLAYRILFFIYTANYIELNALLSELTPLEKESPPVKHALATRSAVTSGNYHRFFRLYLTVPHLGGYLMDKFIVRERFIALATICSGYKSPMSLNIRFITDELAFETHEETARFITEHAGLEFLEQKGEEVCMKCNTSLAAIFKSQSQTASQSVDTKGQT